MQRNSSGFIEVGVRIASSRKSMQRINVSSFSQFSAGGSLTEKVLQRFPEARERYTSVRYLLMPRASKQVKNGFKE